MSINTRTHHRAATQKSAHSKPQPKDPRDQLMDWAHEGSLEGIDRISEFIERENDPDLIGFAKCAYDEASYNYYIPKNETEEKDFILSKMIYDRELRIDELQIDLMSADLRSQKMEIDKNIHAKVMKSNPKNKLWEYRFSPDLHTMASDEPEEIRDDIDYELAWIDEAKKSIKTKRYHFIPADVLESVHLDCEEYEPGLEPCPNGCGNY